MNTRRRRSCARACFSRLGYAPAPIPSGVGAPVAGRDPGCMTHCAGCRCGCGRPYSRISAIGIDAEPDAPLPLMVCWIWSRPLRNGTGSP